MLSDTECMRARVAPSRGGNISSRTKTREKECAIRFAPGSIGSSHCARTEFSSLSDRPHLHMRKYACEVSSKGSMQSLELSRASLACDLRYIGSLDNEHVDTSMSLRKFTRFSCDIGNCTAWKFALVWRDCGIWFLGSVIRSVRDVWKYKYVYIERNIII